MSSFALRSIIPPYLLHRIISHGTDQQRQCAQWSLMHVQSLMVENQRVLPIHSVNAPGLIDRSIYDAGHQQQLPGPLIRSEWQSSNGDVAANEAFKYLGATYDFFWQVFKRNSLDNLGLPLKASVHYGRDYQNAFWNGEQMVFGDGDGAIFNRFTASIDIIAHELTHGVTESESNLIYSGQSGALNESLSDVFGSLVKQFHLQQTAEQADWLIGEGIFASGISGDGLRSLSAPGTAYHDPLLGEDPQPAHMMNYINTREDNGGVHLNSGIPNHAFYLVASALGGFAWEKAGPIWYDTLCDKSLPPNVDFSAFARATISHARYRFGPSAADAVEYAWKHVGVELTAGLL